MQLITLGDCRLAEAMRLRLRLDPKLDHIRLLGHFLIQAFCKIVRFVCVPIDSRHFSMTSHADHRVDQSSTRTCPRFCSVTYRSSK